MSQKLESDELEIDEELQFNRPDFGIKEHIWADAVNEVTAILIEKARKRQLINYLELANMVTAIDFNDPDYPFYRVIPYIVGEISVTEHEHSRPLLSAIVVNNQTHVPGNGFYTLARHLGHTFTDKDVYASQEIRNCFTYWRTHK